MDRSLPFLDTYDALGDLHTTLMQLAKLTTAETTPVGGASPIVYSMLRERIMSRLLIGGLVQTILIDHEELPPDRLFGSGSLYTDIAASLSSTRRVMEDLVALPFEQVKDRTDPEQVIHDLKEFREQCLSQLTHPDREGGAKEYRLAHDTLCAHGQFFVPIFTLVCPDAETFKAEYLRTILPENEKRPYLENQFRELLSYFGEYDKPTAQPAVSASSWTGRESARGRLAVIRQMVPVVLEALEQLIEGREELLHNQVPTAQDIEALALLRALHCEIGELLRALDQGRSIERALGKIATIADKVFVISAETRELLVAGLPALGATAIASLATLKGLELIFGGDVGPVEAATTLAGTGTIFAALSAAKMAKGRAAPDVPPTT